MLCRLCRTRFQGFAVGGRAAIFVALLGSDNVSTFREECVRGGATSRCGDCGLTARQRPDAFANDLPAKTGAVLASSRRNAPSALSRRLHLAFYPYPNITHVLNPNG